MRAHQTLHIAFGSREREVPLKKETRLTGRVEKHNKNDGSDCADAYKHSSRKLTTVPMQAIRSSIWGIWLECSNNAQRMSGT